MKIFSFPLHAYQVSLKLRPLKIYRRNHALIEIWTASVSRI